MSQATRTLVQVAACGASLFMAVQSYANGAACDWLAAAVYGLTALAILALTEPFGMPE